MAMDNLQEAWHGLSTGRKSNIELQEMTAEKMHPVLRGIRIQLAIEMAVFSILLIFYYDMFDGNQKPLWANTALTTALSVQILHHLVGYWLATRGIYGDNIRQLLTAQLKKMKTYAAAAVIFRAITAACLLLFFSSVIVFTSYKYWMLAGISLFVLLQLILLAKIWMVRIKQIRNTKDEFATM